MEWLDVIQGPIDYILSDLDPGSWSLEVKVFLRKTLFKMVVESRDRNQNVVY